MGKTRGKTGGKAKRKRNGEAKQPEKRVKERETVTQGNMADKRKNKDT